MKAKVDFVFHLKEDTGQPAVYTEGESKDGIKELKVKKGEEVPEEIQEYLFLYLKDYLELEYKDGIAVVPDNLKGKEPKPIISKRKYSEESLHKVYEKDGMDGLKKIGKKFDPPITDRSYKKLINEILTAQERERRLG